MKEYFRIDNHIFILVKKNDPTCKACPLNIIEGQLCSNYKLLINNELKRKCCHFAYEEFKLVTDKKERLIALLSEDTKEIKFIEDETNLNFTGWLLKCLLK